MDPKIAHINRLETTRLTVRRLEEGDADFMYTLVNTPAWINYIGDKKIDSIQAAATYIQSIVRHPLKHYWVICIKADQQRAGIVTFMQRDHLEYPDFGFAFLPSYTKQGYAFEVCRTILARIFQVGAIQAVFAITLTHNVSSISLLQKLGFVQWNEFEQDGDRLYAFKLSNDAAFIIDLIEQFYSVFDNKNDIVPDWGLIHELCIPQATIIKQSGLIYEQYDLESFLAPRKIILADGTLTGFSERALNGDTKVIGHLAQHASRFEKKGIRHGQSFHTYGNKLFQLIKTEAGWRISSVVWEEE